MSQISLEGHPIDIVMPGHPDLLMGGITDQGVAVMEKTRAQIAEEFDQIIIFSGTDTRSTESADVLRGVSDAVVIKSELLDPGYENPRAIGEDLAGLLGDVLEAAGVEAPDNAGFVYVAGAPVVAAAKGLEQIEAARGGAKPGEIVAFKEPRWRSFIGKLAARSAAADTARLAVA